MRVIAGSARRLILDTPKGMTTRPTQDRVKETLFNMIQDDVVGGRFLDLYAGSGQMGIEALSRGARYAFFIDQNKEAELCIRNNLKKTHLDEKGQVMKTEVLSALATWHEGTVDVVFMDPPYDNGLELQALAALKDHKIITPESLVVVEASLQTSFDCLDSLGYEILKVKEYKTNKHVFCALKSES